MWKTALFGWRRHSCQIPLWCFMANPPVRSCALPSLIRRRRTRAPSTDGGSWGWLKAGSFRAVEAWQPRFPDTPILYPLSSCCGGIPAVVRSATCLTTCNNALPSGNGRMSAISISLSRAALIRTCKESISRQVGIRPAQRWRAFVPPDAGWARMKGQKRRPGSVACRQGKKKPPRRAAEKF